MFDEKYLNNLYQGVSGFISYKPNEKQENEQDDIYLTYGEVVPAGIKRLLEYANVGPNDVICDLGSGVGKAVIQSFLNTPAKRCFGIEASPLRYASSMAVLKRLQEEHPALFNGDRELNFYQGNFLRSDLKGTTIIYTGSTCFSTQLMAKIGEMIDRTPSIRCVMSLKPVPCALPLDQILDVEASWVNLTKCHVYRRQE
jgi:histone methylation protein DOT1